MVKTDSFIFRYGNCWEDPIYLIDQLGEIEGKRVLSICSGGDNSLSLLTQNPSEVVVVDVNPIQIYLIEIKMAAIKYLNHDSCLSFLGYNSGKQRWEIYVELRYYLSDNAKAFWDSKRKIIDNGLVVQARLEKNLHFFAKYYRPFIHSRKAVNILLKKKSSYEQKLVYENLWNTPWWRFLFRLFFSNTVLKRIAPDPYFFSYVNENVGAYLLKKTERHFSSEICQDNPFLHYALKGHFADCLPHAWKKENFESIKIQLHKIKLHCGFAEEICNNKSRFDAFNLSNIFEYTTEGECQHIAHGLLAGANKNARFVYWNILLPRKLSELLPYDFHEVHNSENNSSEIDHGWIYFRSITDIVR
jgi:S-adenosylmethionine-diacylglycerol 3-amino-3-carboxypropyl transferase